MISRDLVSHFEWCHILDQMSERSYAQNITKKHTQISSEDCVRLFPCYVHIWKPFRWHKSTSIPARMNNYIHHKLWVETIYPFRNMNGAIVEFGNYRQISNIRRSLVGNKLVDHTDVVGASPLVLRLSEIWRYLKRVCINLSACIYGLWELHAFDRSPTSISDRILHIWNVLAK